MYLPAPPPSKKFTEDPELPPVFVEARAPEKYGARETIFPSISPGVRIPGTALWLGIVSYRLD